MKIKWLKNPEEHDFTAAGDYLLLIYPPAVVGRIVQRLHNAVETEFKAKDIFRASGLSLLGISNSHVGKNIRKIKDGKELSPILLIRDSILGRVIIADGYHRLCAVYAIDEDAEIRCRLI